MFVMHYKSDYPEDIVTTTKIVVKDPDVSLSELFSAFIRMTEIMGYQPGSWEDIIDKAYGACVIHATSNDDYNIYDFAIANMI